MAQIIIKVPRSIACVSNTFPDKRFECKAEVVSDIKGDERQSLKGRGGGEVRRWAALLLRRRRRRKRKKSSSAGRGAQRPFPRLGAPPPDSRSAGPHSVALQSPAGPRGRGRPPRPPPRRAALCPPAERRARTALRRQGNGKRNRFFFLRGFLSLCV
ncbi:uncharacterized protein LOC143694088 [Agelaius phoeniceus]|uniref:uncharacterized protein LOC143694088 n=1 Tax=Agelaius phoeniceus TaxID=39638 RepID=UPI004054EC4D